MSDRAFYVFVALIFLVILGLTGTVVILAFIPPTPAVAPTAAEPTQTPIVLLETDCQTFPETGKTVCGKFLAYWLEHGALAQQGYPISNERTEVSELNGKAYKSQYFERAVFEYHPENQPPFDVLLSLTGAILYKNKYPQGTPELKELPPEMRPEGGLFFSQTRKNVRGVFLDYWLNNGGTLQFGYPVSSPFLERSQTDDKEYIVQYFERAVFEFHPDFQPPNNVLPSLLGRFHFNRKYPNGEPTPERTATVVVTGTDQTTDNAQQTPGDAKPSVVRSPSSVQTECTFDYVRGEIEQFVRAWNDRRTDDLAGMFANDATLTFTLDAPDEDVVDSTQTATGRAEIERLLAERLSGQEQMRYDRIYQLDSPGRPVDPAVYLLGGLRSPNGATGVLYGKFLYDCAKGGLSSATLRDDGSTRP